MPNKGYKRTKEHNAKIRLAHIGMKHTEETKRKMSKSHKGFKHSEETKIKMKKFKPLEETRKKIRAGNYKRYLSGEMQKRISAKLQGILLDDWNGFSSTKNFRIRQSEEYKLWRKAVFQRDNYTCIWCGKKDQTIQADHIKSFSLFPELRFAIDNGRTLCKNCHKTTDTYAGKSNKKRSQLINK